MDINSELFMEAFRAGQQQAFSHVHNEYSKALLQFAAGITHDLRDAEDIKQDTFLKLWKLHGNFNTLNDIRAFLFVTARNACYDFLKHERVRRDNQAGIAHQLQQHLTTEIPPEQKERDEIELRLLQMFEDAPEEVKTYFSEGESAKKTGSLFGITGRTLLRMKDRFINELRRNRGPW